MAASPVARRSRACSPACRHCFICPLKCSRALAAFQSAGPVSLCSCGCRNAPLHCPHCGDCSVKGRSLALRMPCASISTVVGASMRPWPDSWCRSERACQCRPGSKVMRVASGVQWPLRDPSNVSAVACGCPFMCHWVLLNVAFAVAACTRVLLSLSVASACSATSPVQLPGGRGSPRIAASFSNSGSGARASSHAGCCAGWRPRRNRAVAFCPS